MTVAAYVAIGCAIIATVSCVLAARYASSASKSATKLHSTASTLAELIEIRDYMAKLDRWAKLINSRDAMTEHRAREREEASEHGSQTNSKDELRRRAGLIAGQPPRHREVQ